MKILPAYATPKSLMIAASVNAGLLFGLFLCPGGMQSDGSFPGYYILLLVIAAVVVGSVLLGLLSLAAIHAAREKEVRPLSALCFFLLGVAMLVVRAKLSNSNIPLSNTLGLGFYICYFCGIAFFVSFWLRIRNLKQRNIIIASALVLCICLMVVIDSRFRLRHFGRGIGAEIVAMRRHSRQDSSVNLQDWAKLQIGMTTDQVRDLLGNPPNYMRNDSIDENGNSATDEQEREVWQYTDKHAISPDGAPHPQAYIVCFDHNGIVTLFRSPKAGDRKSQPGDK